MLCHAVRYMFLARSIVYDCGDLLLWIDDGKKMVQHSAAASAPAKIERALHSGNAEPYAYCCKYGATLVLSRPRPQARNGVRCTSCVTSGSHLPSIGPAE